ncbi:hypothetical protein VTK73DRAFT_4693 [Phialemonium thermophilum]|uniref:Uncharacterized protein n=1 Tax=Phialemonium thermophilum TaxID=223376 RepID=A0ABR3V6U0_9PEZI
MAPGVGIAPTYTVSRVVLSDAVCLVRGDRHYTTDYSPRNLTNWGYNEVQYDLAVNHGCVFYKLFLRAFPDHFKPDSVYAHYPMVTPAENRRILTDLGRAHLFDFAPPAAIPPRVEVTSYGGARYVLENQDKYRVTWHEGLTFLMDAGGARFMLSGDTAFHAAQRRCMHGLLYREGWRPHVRAFYREPSRQVDIVRDVGNLAHVHFAARVLGLPLKTARTPRGVYTEHELYAVLAIIFVCIFFDLDPAKSFPLRQAARAVTQQLGKLVEAEVKLVRTLGAGVVGGLFSKAAAGFAARKDDPLAAYGVHMIQGLLRSGLSAYDVAWSHIVPTAGAMVPNQAEVFAQAVDFYLSPEGRPYLADIHSVATQPPSDQTDALLLGYAMEGIPL